MNKKGFVKVRSAIMLNNKDIIEHLDNGKFIPTDDFNERINEQTPEFREPIITFINDVIPYNWGIFFTPHTDSIFDAHIYCENENEFLLIVDIIKDKLKHKVFKEFYNKRSVSQIDTQS